MTFLLDKGEKNQHNKKGDAQMPCIAVVGLRPAAIRLYLRT